MEQKSIDPKYVAETVKLIRQQLKWTQENLADASSLSTRTIEKLESGRHRPSIQTMKSIAAVIGAGEKIFQKPTQQDTENLYRSLQLAAKTTIGLKTNEVSSLSDFLQSFRQTHATMVDYSSVIEDEALEIAASLATEFCELNDIWDDVSHSHRVEFSKSFFDSCCELEVLSYSVHLGNFQQMRKGSKANPLIFNVGVMIVAKQDASREFLHAIVKLENGWEVLPEDRIEAPPLD